MRHPDPLYLADFSAGGLSPAPAISVRAHLYFCSTCSDHVDSLAEIGGSLLERVTPSTMGKDALGRLFTRIDGERVPVAAPNSAKADEELDQLPAMVRRLIPRAGLAWQFLSPSLKVARIPVGESRFELALHKIRAGGSAPEHDHRGLEITVVLQGSFSDDDGVYQEGDFLVREPGDVHTPIATQNEECICLSACGAPIRMVGPLKRLLNPFISFKPA